MKRLFVLRNTEGKVLRMDGEIEDFSSKLEAKVVRDELNGALGASIWRVSRGPDNLKSAKPNHRAISGLPKYQRGNRGHF
jgi:hypothetical protein